MGALTVVNPGAVQTRAEFTEEQIQLIKDTCCKGATNVELSLFLEVCRSKRLDPFAKQIHAIKRWDADSGREVMSFQTGIDGFRLIAERSKEYAGQSAPLWCGDDGAWKDVWLSKTPPAAAKVSVHRHGFKEPMTRIAKYSEFAQTKKDKTPTRMWATMPTNQLAKCAEALALRAAFPEELSGLYVHEEMEQADNERPAAKSRQEAIADAQEVATKKIAKMATGAVVDAEFVDPEVDHLGVSQADMVNDPGPTPPAQWIKDMMPAMAEMKERLGEADYRAIMTGAGYKNKNELMKAGRQAASAVYKQMVARIKYLKVRAGDIDELKEMRAKDPLFETWMAANCSITWADLEQASGDEITRILAAARER